LLAKPPPPLPSPAAKAKGPVLFSRPNAPLFGLLVQAENGPSSPFLPTRPFPSGLSFISGFYAIPVSPARACTFLFSFRLLRSILVSFPAGCFFDDPDCFPALSVCRSLPPPLVYSFPPPAEIFLKPARRYDRIFLFGCFFRDALLSPSSPHLPPGSVLIPLLKPAGSMLSEGALFVFPFAPSNLPPPPPPIFQATGSLSRIRLVFFFRFLGTFLVPLFWWFVV